MHPIIAAFLTLAVLAANSSLAFQPYSSFVSSGLHSPALRYNANTNAGGRSKAFVSAAEYYQPPFRYNKRFNFLNKAKVDDSNDVVTKDSTSSLDGNNKDEKQEGNDFEYIKDKVSMFVEMALPYFKESKNGRWLFAGMIGLTLLNSGVSVVFSYVGKDFWNALNSKDQEEFYKMMFKYAGALLVGSPVSVLYAFQRERLAVAWREWMTDRTLQLYSQNRVYYSLERGSDADIDNPDQRITEDVRSFTAFSLQLFLTISTSLIDLASFSFILYSIQPQLFATIIAYAMFGTVTTSFIGKKLIGLNYEKLQKEADFRYSLVRIRENAESIAFYAGEDIEGKEVSKRLDKVIENKKDIITSQRNLGKNLYFFSLPC
jgi:ABC-type uncharacterized transport system fused permease/ATPase subunit